MLSLLDADWTLAFLCRLIATSLICGGDSDRQESAEVPDESGEPSKDEVCAIEAAVTARSIGHGDSEDDQPCNLGFCLVAGDPSSCALGTVLGQLSTK